MQAWESDRSKARAGLSVSERRRSRSAGNNLDTTYSGIIRDSGSLTKVGTGALTLSGANTYTGGTTVNNGPLIVNGSIAGNAEVKSGATLKGTGSIAGVLTCEDGSICAPGTARARSRSAASTSMSGSTFEFELGASRDHIVVTSHGGRWTLGGVLNISLLDGFIPIEPFSLFEGSIETLSGTFSAVNARSSTDTRWDWLHRCSSVVYRFVDAGDFKNDGVLDAADYVLWRKGLGTTYTQDHYNVWPRALRVGGPVGRRSGSSSNSAVPEPASAILLMLTFSSLARACVADRLGVDVARNPLPERVSAMPRMTNKIATIALGAVLAAMLVLSPARLLPRSGPAPATMEYGLELVTGPSCRTRPRPMSTLAATACPTSSTSRPAVSSDPFRSATRSTTLTPSRQARA